MTMNELTNCLPDHPNIKLFCSSKVNGNMSFGFGEKAEVFNNRKTFFASINIDIKNTSNFKIQNSDIITVVTDDFYKGFGSISDVEIKTDAIITNIKNVFFYIAFGDCIPCIIYNKASNTIGYAHLGWKSICLDLHNKVLKQILNMEISQLSDIYVFIGPCIKVPTYCFDYPAQLDMPEWKNYVCLLDNGKYSVDLNRFVIDGLIFNGVEESHIYYSSVDTGIHPDFYSHYRSMNVPNTIEGRFIFGVGLT